MTLTMSHPNMYNDKVFSYQDFMAFDKTNAVKSSCSAARSATTAIN